MAQFRYSSGMTNFHFQVTVVPVVGGESLSLPATEITGLDDGTTSVFYHRVGADTHLVPFSGLTTGGTVTIEGANFYNLKDMENLKKWRDQVTGNAPFGSIGGEYRNIIIKPCAYDENGDEIMPDSPIDFRHIELTGCVATKLSISNFSMSSPAISKWTIELKPTTIEIIGPSSDPGVGKAPIQSP
jgi:hypothetical protein